MEEFRCYLTRDDFLTLRNSNWMKAIRSMRSLIWDYIARICCFVSERDFIFTLLLENKFSEFEFLSLKFIKFLTLKSKEGKREGMYKNILMNVFHTQNTSRYLEFFFLRISDYSKSS